jgi:hypothetical protein
MLFLASLECATVQNKISLITQVYQIWYVAAHADKFPKTDSLFTTAQQALPFLPHLERSEQILVGAEFLAEKLR